MPNALPGLGFYVSAAIAVSAFASVPASAQDAVTAEALFRAGRDALAQADYATACARFEESKRLEPAPGTLLNLGECRERLGQLASAWQAYSEAADLLPAGDLRRDHAQKRRDEIAPKLATITLSLAKHTPADCVLRQGALSIGQSVAGVPLPVDEGDVAFVLQCPGRRDTTSRLRVENGRTYVLSLSPGPLQTTVAGPVAPKPTTPKEDDTKPVGSSPLFVAGIVTICFGGVGLITGAVTGGLAIDRKSTVDDTCTRQPNGRLGCPPEGVDAADEGSALATASTVGFAAGGALLALGLTLTIVDLVSVEEPASVSVAPLPGGGWAGLTVGF
jgi:hypothetical protein